MTQTITKQLEELSSASSEPMEVPWSDEVVAALAAPLRQAVFTEKFADEFNKFVFIDYPMQSSVQEFGEYVRPAFIDEQGKQHPELRGPVVPLNSIPNYTSVLEVESKPMTPEDEEEIALQHLFYAYAMDGQEFDEHYY